GGGHHETRSRTHPGADRLRRSTHPTIVLGPGRGEVPLAQRAVRRRRTARADRGRGTRHRLASHHRAHRPLGPCQPDRREGPDPPSHLKVSEEVMEFLTELVTNVPEGTEEATEEETKA